MPTYFNYLSAVFTFLYLYIFTPLSIILESYILVAYSINMVWDPQIVPEQKFRRGVAVFFPFLLSLYSVLASEIYSGSIELALSPFYVLLGVGLLIGFGFMAWISRIDESEELFGHFADFWRGFLRFGMLP